MALLYFVVGCGSARLEAAPGHLPIALHASSEMPLVCVSVSVAMHVSEVSA